MASAGSCVTYKMHWHRDGIRNAYCSVIFADSVCLLQSQLRRKLTGQKLAWSKYATVLAPVPMGSSYFIIKTPETANPAPTQHRNFSRRIAICASAKHRCGISLPIRFIYVDRYRSLGRTGLKVSVLSLGAWTTFGGTAAEKTCEDCMTKALEMGVNFFDNVCSVGRRGGRGCSEDESKGGGERGILVPSVSLHTPIFDSPPPPPSPLTRISSLCIVVCALKRKHRWC